MAELEIHFMGLLMPKVGMRTVETFRVPAQAAFFGSSTKARIAQQAVGTNPGKLSHL